MLNQGNIAAIPRMYAPRSSVRSRRFGLNFWLLILFLLSIYILPYLRVKFGFPLLVPLREFFAIILFYINFNKIMKTRWPLWLYLLVGVLLGGFIISSNYSVAFITLRTILQFVLVYVFSRVVIKNKRQLLYCLRMFYVIGFICLFMIIIQLIIGPIEIINMRESLDIGSMRFGFARLSTIFGNTITTGMLLLIFLGQTITVMKEGFKKYVLIILTIVGIVTTISKASIIMMLAVLMLYLFYSLKTMNTRKFIKISLIIILSLCIAKITVNNLSINNLTYMANVTLVEQMEGDFQSRLIEKPAIGIKIMRDLSPLTFLVGAGFDTAGQAASRIGGIKPHNAVLEIFMTMGLMGLLIYGYIFILLVRMAIKVKPETLLDVHLKGLAIGVVVALMSAALVDPHITHILMLPAFFLLGVSKLYSYIEGYHISKAVER